ncbi:glycosyltransferase [Paramicrobacterium chengjingii]|uniref:D-inositol 3-phosphate glycosyltransferase n=1 Tax=Paramicrobacterium chengjingii TaxID=2769067 RepID=A0ABX6YFB5_9MICO|nr:glycosyltransferase [Microbacterium chengjingii]QPZ37481.1 glycosyltransferase [Microbacterium chengjingii]
MAGVLVHEWIEKIGGSENVLEALSHIFPDADMLCLWNNAAERFPDRVVRETALARSPLRGRKAAALPFVPAVWRNQTNHDYDWALVSSHSFAHHVSFRSQRPDFKKLVYTHTPARYIWTPELDARGRSVSARLAAPVFKGVDRRRAQEATSIAANSRYVAMRVKYAWQRDSEVIYPPVDVEAIQAITDWSSQLGEEEAQVATSLPSAFVLGASRWIPYKRLELTIDVAEALGMPAVIAGAGPEEKFLRSRAADSSVPVKFVHSPSNALLRTLYQRAILFVFPAVEDFGIMPVEAMAVGTPVLCNARGGTRESVLDGQTGRQIEDWQSASEVLAAARDAIACNRSVTRDHAATFSKTQFSRRITEWQKSQVS